MKPRVRDTHTVYSDMYVRERLSWFSTRSDLRNLSSPNFGTDEAPGPQQLHQCSQRTIPVQIFEKDAELAREPATLGMFTVDVLDAWDSSATLRGPRALI